MGTTSEHPGTILRDTFGTAGQEVAGFPDHGGMVTLVRDGRHVRLELYGEPLRHAGPVRSSLVLSQPRTVCR